jgi:hypothetical protein
MYVSPSSGTSSWTTQSTAGKSSPRAATSVANRQQVDVVVNFWKTVSRFDCFCLPCSSSRGVPGWSLQKVS